MEEYALFSYVRCKLILNWSIDSAQSQEDLFIYLFFRWGEDIHKLILKFIWKC